MAKRCEVCKRTYPDKELACPYCADAIEVVMEDEGSEVPRASKKKGKGSTARPAEPDSGVMDVEFADVVEAEEETPAVEIVDEDSGTRKPAPPSKAPPSKPGQPTKMAGRTAQPTKLARKSPAPTMLAPGSGDDDVIDAVIDEADEPSKPGKGQPPPTAAGKAGAEDKGTKPAAPPTKLAPKIAQPTKLASKSPAPTMLAPADADEDIIEAIEDDEVTQAPPKKPEGQAKGPASKKGAPPDSAAQHIPHMEIDDVVEAVEDEDAIEAVEAVEADEPISAVEAGEAADIVEAVDDDSVDLGAMPPAAPATPAPESEAPSKERSVIDALDLLSGGMDVGSSSNVTLGESPPGKAGSASGLDLIAEAQESGVDLNQTPEKPADSLPMPSSTTRAEEEAAAVLADESAADFAVDDSSAVNLGAESTTKNPFASEEADLDLGAIGSSAGTNKKLSGSSSEVGKQEEEVGVVEEGEETVATDEEVVASAAEDEDAIGAAAEDEDAIGAAEEDEAPASGVKAKAGSTSAPRPKYGRRWVGGALVGVILSGAAAGVLWYLEIIKVPGLSKPDKPIGPSPEVAKLKAEKDKATNDLVVVKKDKEKAERAATAFKEGKSAAERHLAKLKEQLVSAKYAKESDKSLEDGLKNLIGDLTKAGTLLDKKDDLPAVPKEVDSLVKANNKAKKALAKVIGALDKEDPLKKAIKDKDPDEGLKLLGEDHKTQFGLKTKMEQDLQTVVSTMGKDDPLKTMFKGKGLEDSVKLLGEDRNKARAALDGIVKAMDKDDMGTDPLKPLFKGKSLDEAVKLFGEDRNKARTALDTVVAGMDKEEDPLRDMFKDQPLDKGITLLGTARNTLQRGITTRLKTKNLVDKKAKVDDILSAVDKMLSKADSPLVIAMAQVAGTLGDAGASMGAAVTRAYDWSKWAADMQAEIAYFRIREPFVRAPEGMLDSWIGLLQDANHKDAEATAKKAMRDARWVKDQDPRSSAATKAKAAYVMGLALRNQLKYVEALPFLKEAAPNEEKADDAAWQKHARQVRDELVRASTYYDGFDDLVGAGQLAGAKLKRLLDEISAALKVTKEQGRLLALRSRVRLELARKQAKDMEAGTPGVKEARADAEAAIKAEAVAEGYYAVGRLDEELGNLDEAKKAYRQAIAKHTGSKDELSMYHEALSRVLGQKKEKPAEPDKNDKKRGKGKRERAELRRAMPACPELARVDSSLVLASLVLLACPAAEADEQPKEIDPEVPPEKEVMESIEEAEKAVKAAEEAVQEAEEAVKNKDKKGPQKLARAKVRLAKAYMRLGTSRVRNVEWKEGVDEYRKGLTLLADTDAAPQDLRDALAGLQKILARHPGLNRLTPKSPQNPILALKYYDQGRNYYWAKKYDAAEQEFLKAHQYYKDDPRFLYYLGLARLRQRTPEKIGAAKVDFEDAAKLEQQQQPESTEEVDFALEPVQGKVRKLLNRYRP